MINCPKCGTDNMIGAIFCRTCGDRLNLDEIRPRTLRQVQQSPAARAIVIVYRVVLLVLIAALIAVFIGFFLPPAGRSIPALDAKTLADTSQLYESMFFPDRNQKTYAFSSAQVTGLANERLGLNRAALGDAGFALVPERLQIDCLASGYLRITLCSRLKGKLAVYSTLLLRLEKTEDSVRYQVVAARAGRIPMPASGFSFVTQRVLPLFQNDADLPLLAQLATRIEVTDDSLALTLKATARDKQTLKLFQKRLQALRRREGD